MYERFKPAVSGVTGFALAFALAIGWIGAQSAAAQAPGQKAEQFYKNIKVLQGMDAKLMLLTNLRVEGEEKVGENSTWVVTGRATMLPVVKLYFDKESGILLSTLYQQQSNYCCHVFRVDYQDYWPVNGVRMPSRWTINGPRESVLVYEINDVQVNTPVEDSRFLQPGPATAAR